MNVPNGIYLITAIAAMFLGCQAPPRMDAPIAQRPITSSGAAEELAYLESRGTRFEPAVDHAGDLANVQMIFCDDYFDDRCMEIISRRTPQLRVLSLMIADVTDASVPHLRRLQKLEEAILFRSMVTDKACEHLAAIKTLHTVDLTSTGVTDVGLAELSSLRDLYWVNVCDTGVTHKGVQRMLAAHPTLFLDHDLGRVEP